VSGRHPASRRKTCITFRAVENPRVVIEVPLDERVLLEKTSDFPFFLEPAEAVEALAIQYQRRKPGEAGPAKTGQAEAAPALEDIRTWFDAREGADRQPLLNEVLELLGLMGVPTAAWRMSQSLEEAIGAAEDLRLPVALKAVSASLLHKSDRGGIALNVGDGTSLRNEWLRRKESVMTSRASWCKKWSPSSRELIIGGKRDPSSARRAGRYRRNNGRGHKRTYPRGLLQSTSPRPRTCLGSCREAHIGAVSGDV